MKLFSLLLLGLLAFNARAGEIRSDDPCVLAAVRSALGQAALDRTEGAASDELEAGLTLDVSSQFSTRFDRYSPQLGYYVVAVDASLRTAKTLRYEAYVEQSADLKSCRVRKITSLP